jgi:hypothetical protein
LKDWIPDRVRNDGFFKIISESRQWPETSYQVTGSLRKVGFSEGKWGTVGDLKDRKGEREMLPSELMIGGGAGIWPARGLQEPQYELRPVPSTEWSNMSA